MRKSLGEEIPAQDGSGGSGVLTAQQSPFPIHRWLFPTLLCVASYSALDVRSGRRRLELTSVFVLCALLSLGNRDIWPENLAWVRPSPRFLTWAAIAGLVSGLIPTLIFKQVNTWQPRLSEGILNSSLTPIAEELLFRGLLVWAFGAVLRPCFSRMRLAEYLAPVVAVTLSAFLFAGIHLHRDVDPWHFAYRTMDGMIYGWLRLASGSTASPALMHAAHNFVVFGLPRFFPALTQP